MLELTYNELKDITYERLKRFKVTSNCIPEGNPNDYIEDDGRQYRVCEFKDKITGKEYSFQYIWHSEFDHYFPESFLSEPDGIKFVKVSVINSPVEVKEQIPELAQEQIEDKVLCERYREIEVQPFINLKESKIPRSVIDDICEFLNTPPYSMIGIRKKIYPVCIDYKVEQKSFWRYIQNESAKYKRKKK